MKVSGWKNLPRNKAFIFAANHNSLIDPPLAAAALKTPLHFMAKKELFDIPLFGKLIRKANAFPVRRNASDKSAIKKAMKILSSNKSLLVFPEGGRRESGSAMKGVSFLAHKTSALVVPVGMKNNYDLHHMRRLYVNIAEPVKFPLPPHTKASAQEYEKFAAEILKKIYILAQK
ncbi:MAG: lysophospholipid acyltransferase family protein [Elusimicrobiota bacterium]